MMWTIVLFALLTSLFLLVYYIVAGQAAPAGVGLLSGLVAFLLAGFLKSRFWSPNRARQREKRQ